jgi:hypothetical protein
MRSAIGSLGHENFHTQYIAIKVNFVAMKVNKRSRKNKNIQPAVVLKISGVIAFGRSNLR